MLTVGQDAPDFTLPQDGGDPITLSDLRADLVARPERYTPWLRIYMDQHADQIFGAA